MKNRYSVLRTPPFMGNIMDAPPTVTIDQASGQPDPTNAPPIVFEVVFSEPVYDFTGSDVVLSGTAGASVATVVPV